MALLLHTSIVPWAAFVRQCLTPLRHMTTSAPTSKSSNGKITNLNHIAIAVPLGDLQRAADAFANLGLVISEPLKLPDHGVTTIFVQLGNCKIELLEELGANSPISKFVKGEVERASARGSKWLGGVHHFCVETDDIEAARTALTLQGAKIATDTKIGAHGNPVFFMHPKSASGALVEVEEVAEEH